MTTAQQTRPRRFPLAPLQQRTPAWAPLLLALLLAGGAQAATGTQADIDARYQQDRAACESGKSGEDLATCLREAAAARAAARAGDLAEPDTDYAKNALARCQDLPPSDRDICRQRVLGGSTEGSVAGGGIIREYREITLPPGAAPGRIDANGTTAQHAPVPPRPDAPLPRRAPLDMPQAKPAAPQ